jgi:hypothetical protein
VHAAFYHSPCVPCCICGPLSRILTIVFGSAAEARATPATSTDVCERDWLGNSCCCFRDCCCTRGRAVRVVGHFAKLAVADWTPATGQSCSNRVGAADRGRASAPLMTGRANANGGPSPALVEHGEQGELSHAARVVKSASLARPKHMSRFGG